MARIRIPNLAHIRETNPLLGETLDYIGRTIGNLSLKVAANPEGQTVPPHSPDAISVAAADGIHHVVIQHNSAKIKGINYFLEYSDSPTFANTHTVDLGAGKSHRQMIGNKPTYWRGYAQYPDGKISGHTYFGTAQTPTAVHGGGTLAGPEFPTSTGSGTSSDPAGGHGFGRDAFVSSAALPGKPPSVFQRT